MKLVPCDAQVWGASRYLGVGEGRTQVPTLQTEPGCLDPAPVSASLTVWWFSVFVELPREQMGLSSCPLPGLPLRTCTLR